MYKNKVYSTLHLVEFFMKTRRMWKEFYPSERWVFEKMGKSEAGFGNILDVGCAIGGLGRALNEKFPIESYTGIDINEEAINYANKQVDFPMKSDFYSGDIVTSSDLQGAFYDSVFALSVADWNVDTAGILNACWSKVKPGGRMIISQRLTDQKTVSNEEISYQYIISGDDFDMPDDPSILDKAPYVVLNVKDCLNLLMSLSGTPSEILAYGYWGSPSKTATTPFKKIAFAVICITKSENERNLDDIHFESYLPISLFC